MSKNILVAVSGETPAILTETIYALVRREPNPFIPDEVYVLTTTLGAQRIQQALFDTPRFAQLTAELGLPTQRIHFGPEQVHVMTGADGQALDDLRSVEHNMHAADFILNFLVGLTQRNNGDVCIHASIAGGRKTMSFFMGYALSLVGRPRDELSHVLVSEEFERCPEFYYPTREPAPLCTRDGDTIDASQARVELAPIPFLPLHQYVSDKQRLWEGQGSQPFSFATCIAQTRLAMDAPRIEFLEEECSIAFGETLRLPLQLSESLYAVYLAIAYVQWKDGTGLTLSGRSQAAQRSARILEATNLVMGRGAADLTPEVPSLDRVRTSLSRLHDALLPVLGPWATANIYGVPTQRRSISRTFAAYTESESRVMAPREIAIVIPQGIATAIERMMVVLESARS